MNTLPKNLQKVIDFFEKLPSIGPKTARRLAFYLLRLPQADLKEASENISKLKSTTLYCKVCLNLSDENLCVICQDAKRDRSIIVVVEGVLDLVALEAGDTYNGLYQVLHGRIDPLNHVGPEDIYIDHFLKRIKKDNKIIKEIVIATNPNTEGEATAMYIKNKLKEISKGLKISRLAYGLPIGADVEYADYMTLKRALEGRRKF